MPEKATNPFEVQHQKFDKAASAAVVKRAVIIRNLTQLETIGTEMTGTDGLSADKFAVTMHSAYHNVLTLDENGEVQPPLSVKQKQELVSKRAIYNAFLPEISEEQAPAEPTPVDNIDTAKQKS